MKRLAWLIVASFAFCLFAGCGSGSSSAPTAPKQDPEAMAKRMQEQMKQGPGAVGPAGAAMQKKAPE
jgi:hypothetical protein